MSQRTIQCAFSCQLCGAERVEFEVPVRPVALDILTWMETVVNPRLFQAHRVARNCPAPKSDLWIPIADAEGNEAKHIGGGTKQ
jgi:hypothetical protein